MKVELKVPAMGESISEAQIGQIFKQNGAFVNEEEEILELETEKVNQPIYASASGQLQLNIKQGDTVKVGQLIGTIDAEAAGAKEVMPKKEKQQEIPEVQETNRESFKEVRKTQKEFLEELHQPKENKEEERPLEQDQRHTRKKMSKIRKVIAQRLVSSLHQAAMLTTFNEADMSEIVAIRAKHKESFLQEHGVKLGLNSFFVKAVVEALKEFPEINAYIDGEDIVYRNYYDIGIAISTDRGLVVPVVHNCDQLTFAQIEKQIEGYAKKAREGRLNIEDLKGGGFTITNGGVYGSLLSTPILNPPQSGILGLHKIMKRPIVVDDQIVIRSMMYLALSYDHRIVDGKEAVSFLVKVKEILEHPSVLMFIPEAR